MAAKFFFKLQKTRASYNLLIVGKGLKLGSSAGASVYSLCDLDRTIPAVVDCDGFERPLKIVLKVYTRVPQKDLDRQREERRYQLLLKGRPAWNQGAKI